MYLSSITLRQFRNHRDTVLDVDPRLNLLVGPNGSGKTNFIEAIAVLTTGLSPRSAHPDSMVEWNKDGFFISGTFARESETDQALKLEMKFLNGQRQIRRGDQTLVRLKDLIGMVPLVSFVPEDLAIVKGEPDVRRRSLNLVLMQIDPLYTENLRRYNEALKSRNAAIKQLNEGRLEEDALDPWDEEVLKYGMSLCKTRSEFLGEFSKIFSQIQERVSDGQDRANLTYKPSWVEPWTTGELNRLKNDFRLHRQKDIVIGTTMTGPHRDDMIFFLNGKPMRHFGSEGQMRTSAVAFKLAELEIIRRKKGEDPICLLDDVLSELDERRAHHLLEELVITGQCFVTMTGLESWPRANRPPAVIFQVFPNGHMKTLNKSELIAPL